MVRQRTFYDKDLVQIKMRISLQIKKTHTAFLAHMLRFIRHRRSYEHRDLRPLVSLQSMQSSQRSLHVRRFAVRRDFAGQKMLMTVDIDTAENHLLLVITERSLRDLLHFDGRNLPQSLSKRFNGFSFQILLHSPQPLVMACHSRHRVFGSWAATKRERVRKKEIRLRNRGGWCFSSLLCRPSRLP